MDIDDPAVVTDDLARPRPLLPALPSWVGDRRSWSEIECDHTVPISRDFVDSQEVDAQNRWSFLGMTGRTSDRVGHLWDAPGYPRRTMLDRRAGGVVLEQRTRRFATLERGATFRMLSSLREVIGDRIVRFGHASFDARTGALVYATDVATGHFDHAVRKLLAFGDEEQAELVAPSANAQLDAD